MYVYAYTHEVHMRHGELVGVCNEVRANSIKRQPS